jgi:uncharacterized membrane protein required for colicin V production
VGVVGLFTLRGALRGFFRGAFSLLGWAAGVAAALLFWEVAGRALATRWGIGSLLAYGVAFSLLLLGPYLGLRLIGTALRWLSRVIFLGSMDRVAGAALGAVASGLVIGGVLSLLVATPWAHLFVERSVMAAPLIDVFRHVARAAGL